MSRRMGACVLVCALASQAVAFAADAPQAFSVKEAAAMAVKTQLTVRLAQARNDDAQGRVLQEASDLLPHVLLNARQTRVWRENRAAMGFPSGGVVDYDSFDARVVGVQRLLDVSAFERWRAADRYRAAVRLEKDLVVKQVESAVYVQYVEVLRLESETAAAEADRRLAQDLLSLGTHQKEAGLSSGLDVVRLETRAAVAETRVIRAQIDLANAYVVFDRLVGIPLDARPTLTDSLEPMPTDESAVDAALEIATKNRTEIALADERLKQYVFLLSSAKASRLPTVEITGDLGKAGETPSRMDKKVGKGVLGVSMPLFEGGLIAGAVARADAAVTQARLSAQDQRVQVDEDVRLALQTSVLAAKQVSAAKKAWELSEKEMTMSRDRYAAGIGNNVELVDAQAGLARAHSDYITALAQYQTARVNRFAALGTTGAFDLKHEKGDADGKA